MRDNSDPHRRDRVKKVAVIAVHGISDQKPFESARAIAELLFNQNSSTSCYAAFSERLIRIKVNPVKPRAVVNINDITGWNSWVLRFLNRFLPKWLEPIYSWWRSADERGPFMQRLLTGKPTSADDRLAKPDYLFMRDQIEVFETPKPANYDTICLQGQCTFTEPQTGKTSQTQVHIYEMHWADLSRLGSGFIRIFGEFYQLLFHLGSLGRQSVDLMRAEHQTIEKDRKLGDLFNVWAWYGATQALAGRILSLFLPILNLCLLVVALMSLPGKISQSSAYVGLVAAISTGLLLTIGVGYVFLTQNKTAFWPWLLLPFGLGLTVVFGIQALVTGVFNTGIMFAAYRWLAVEWMVLLGLAIWFVLIKPFSIVRPGADTFAITIGLPLGLMTLGFICLAPDSHIGITQASFHMIEIIYLLLLGGWLVFLVLYFSSLIFALFAIYSIPKSPTSGRILAKQAAWTARYSLAVPSILFSFLTLSLWTALARISKPLFPDTAEGFYEPLFFFKHVQSFPFKPEHFVRLLTVFSGSTLAVFIIFFTLLALVAILWALVPSVLTEVFPIDLKKPDPKNVFAQGLGNWLNNGFRLILGSGFWIVSWMIPFLFLIGTIDGLSLLAGNKESLLNSWFPQLKIFFDSTDTLLAWVAGLLTASATSLIALGSRLNQLSLGLRGVIDAVLDVDNYLRLHPRGDNPSAQIYARYTSLLRYLCQQTPPNEEPTYDAFVIVAHSQGTVITADLLRFLAIDPDPALEELKASKKISLFTMGSPIRQLYGYAFPHLYRWAIQESAPDDPSSLKIPLHANPDPQELLGVKTWVNTFRSGDYVGRYLWRSDRAIHQWLKVNLEHPPQVEIEHPPHYISETPDRSRREFCLGGGAHTHYWDKTAPEVAQEIDRLIREC
jgi:hypothetical protein